MGGSEAPAALSTKNPCARLALRDYDRAFMAQVAAEIDAAPASAAFPRMIEDYGALRAEIRACRSL